MEVHKKIAKERNLDFVWCGYAPCLWTTGKSLASLMERLLGFLK